MNLILFTRKCRYKNNNLVQINQKNIKKYFEKNKKNDFWGVSCGVRLLRNRLSISNLHYFALLR